MGSSGCAASNPIKRAQIVFRLGNGEKTARRCTETYSEGADSSRNDVSSDLVRFQKTHLELWSDMAYYE